MKNQITALLKGSTFVEVRNDLLVFLSPDGKEVTIKAVPNWDGAELLVKGGKQWAVLSTL